MIRRLVEQVRARARRLLTANRRPTVSVKEAPAVERGVSSSSDLDGAFMDAGRVAVRLQSPTQPKESGNRGQIYVAADAATAFEQRLLTLSRNPSTVDPNFIETVGNVRLIGAEGTWKRDVTECIVCETPLREHGNATAIVMLQNAGGETQTVGCHVTCADTLSQTIGEVSSDAADELLGDAL